jgi:hypothetical protein
MGLTCVYLADRGMPRRMARDVELVGVRTIQDLLTRVFA